MRRAGACTSAPSTHPLPQEARLYAFKLPAALHYARVNGLNRITVDPPMAHTLIVSAGKAWQDLQQALASLGWGESRLAEAGIRLLKIGMVWPLDADIVRAAAKGVERIVVIEEKRPILEDQIRGILYGRAGAPKLIGKHLQGSGFDDARGPVAFPDHGEIAPPLVARVLKAVVPGLGDAGAPAGMSTAAVAAVASDGLRFGQEAFR